MRRTIESLEVRQLMASNLPAGFAETVYVAGFDTPTAQAFAPDGRLFVLEKAGKVRVVTSGGALVSTPFVSLSVDTAQDRGLVSLAFDPNFQANGYLYLWYTKTDGAGTRNRLSRFTASGNTAAPGSETVLLEVPHATNIHTGGAMSFGADGMLYLGVGDGGESFRAQDMNDLRGKILRLNVANPANIVPSDNPYVGQAGVRPEIFASGMRNPFSGQMKPGTNTFYVNDVGQDNAEEVDVIVARGNYGWPNAEGFSSNPAYTNPIYAYSHAGFSSAAITGAAFYESTQFPAEYKGSYFFADYLNGFMRRLDASGNVHEFGTDVAGPLDIDLGPDGSLYYSSAFGTGFTGTNRPVYRISYTSSANRAPAAVASATTPTNGLAPLTVAFTGNGSTDPDGDALSYAWNFGDGTTATGKDVSKTYAVNGTYFATLTVSDGRGGTNTSQSIRVDVGNRAPTGVIQTPAPTLTYTAGQTINFSGSASDPEDGTLAASKFSWRVYLVHNTHEHEFAGPFNGVTSGSFIVPTNGHVEDDHHYRIQLTVTDAGGLTHTSSREVHPVTSDVTLAANVTGLSLALDGQPLAAPISDGSLVGATRAISAPLTQTLNGATYEFVSWSDGGAATHDVTVGATDRTYTATYRLAVPVQTALAPTADSYVRSSSAGSNFGSATSLFAKRSSSDNRHTYIKFDTTSVTGTVQSVKLRLFAKLESSAATGVLTEVFGTSTGWTETGIKWNNKPAATTAKLAGVTVSGTVGGWYELDITSYVVSERAAGRNVIGLVLQNPTNSTPSVVFNSRNASTNKPQLLVTTGAAPPPASQTPFSGTPIAVPAGTIQAEDFDNGGEGVAFHDVTGANEGDNPGYRSSAVDLEVAGDTGGGANVGWVKAGEWLEYTINVATAGTYTFDARVAMLGPGGAFSVTLDGGALTSFAIPDTGGYQSYQTVSKTGVVLPAGQHVLRVTADTEGPSGFAGNINWMRFSGATAVTPPNAPTNLTATAPSASQVNLSWADNSTNETNFKVERKTGAGGTWQQIATPTAASHSDTTVAANTTYVYRVRATNTGGDSAYSNEFTITTPPATVAQAPFGGVAWPIAGTIEVENFDEGGEGVAYHDVDAAQQGGAYRTNTGVDVETADDTGGGHNVGYTRAGEWLEYTVNVAATGTYDFEIRVASGNPGGTFHLEFNGVDKTGAIALPNTGGWGNWQTVTATGVQLTAGTHVMRLAIDTSNLAGQDVGRINWIRASLATPPAGQTPYGGTARSISGTIEAEDFDNGGEGVAYHDNDAAQLGGAYRANVGVDVETADDTGGGFNVGYTRAGEWMEYTVNVGIAGNYRFEFRVASGNPGGTFHVEFDGVDKTGPITLPNTGGWSNWQTVVAAPVSLSAGQQVMRVVFDTSAASGQDIGRLNWIKVTPFSISQQTPYYGSPVQMPGRVQAEDFDNGGEGVAYHDTTAANEANTNYRTSGVEIEVSGDTGGGYNVGWLKTGEWLEYTINVPTAGFYQLDLRVASLGAGGGVTLLFDGVDRTGNIPIPDTGGWQTYQTITKSVQLNAGTQVMRLFVNSEGPSGFAGNINYIDLTAAVSPAVSTSLR